MFQKKKKYLLLILLSIIFLNIDVYCQWTPGPANPDTLTLAVISGGQVQWKFKSITEMKAGAGITYSDWTNFNLFFNDKGTDDNLDLVCYAKDVLYGEKGGTLNPNIIEVRATCPGCAGVTTFGWQNLATSPGITLIEDIDGSDGGTNYDIHIDFRCGFAGLIGETSDYYYVDIIFELEGH